MSDVLLKELNDLKTKNQEEEASKREEEAQKEKAKIWNATSKEDRPRVEMTQEGGTGNMLTDSKIDIDDEDAFDDFLKERGIDTSKFKVDSGSVKVKSWQIYNEEWRYSYGFNIIRRPESLTPSEPLYEGYDFPVPPKLDTVKPRHSVVMVSDTHIGKGYEAGAGTDFLINQWRESFTNAMGDEVFDSLTVAFCGDLIEGYISQDGKNIISCDLPLVQQIHEATRLVEWTITKALNHAKTLKVAVVPGNHGETTRKQGVLNGDNFDIMIVEAAMDLLARTWGDDFNNRVEFYKPLDHETAVTWSQGGTNISMVHGHKFRGKMTGASKWWLNNIVARDETAESSILIAGHYHSFQVDNIAQGRFILFAPALERCSQWFKDSTGTTADGGMLIFDVEDQRPANISIK